MLELDYGELEGTPVLDVPAVTGPCGRPTSSSAPQVASHSPRWVPGCANRAGSHWAAAVDRPGAVVLVSHVSPVKAAVVWALGVGDQIAWRTQLDNASITQVLMRGNRPALSLFNATEHLDGLVARQLTRPLGIVVHAMIRARRKNGENAAPLLRSWVPRPLA